MAGKLYHYILENGSKMKYIYPETIIDAAGFAGNAFATYYILFNSLIPLAMLVTLEIAKLSYSKMIENDIEMISYSTDPKNNFVQETRI